MSLATASTDAAPVARRRLAVFAIEDTLGRGRQSVVYRARRDGQPVALKVARRAQLAACRGRDDFRTEFNALTALIGPGVARGLDHGVSGEEAWLAMEYAPGGSLARECAAGSASRVAALFAQAAGALAGVHRSGWVHRDVKPAHLLRRADGSVALCDFGIACRQGAAPAVSPGAIVGTPCYAAPEQSEGAAAAATADVYSLGACFYELLCGRPPYPGETPTELLGQHLVAPLPALLPHHAGWQPLLHAMLAKDPASRPADGQAVVAELQRIPRKPS